MARWVTPDEFAELKRIGEAMGIGHVESGPLTRSSYHARQAADAADVETVVATSPGLTGSGRRRQTGAMGRTYDAIPDHLAEWMEEQPVFFVASAPLSADGHVNLSPKGDDTFRVIDANTVAYLDLTGSGAETIAHTRENGRLTIMFCSFGDKPNIVRLFGQGEAVLPGPPRLRRTWSPGSPTTPAPGASSACRSTEITTSCGYARAR